MKIHHRIGLLDSFRCIAAMSVVLYHFTYRWSVPSAGAVCPYGTFFGNIFQFGRFGVHFFFIISGFVISYTLEHTSGSKAFFRNRFARLFPPVLLCSIISFFMARALDDTHIFPGAHSLQSFVPSLTFISPGTWYLFTGHVFSWINGSYWSLWTEVQFYILSAMLYFTGRRYFVKNILICAVVLSCMTYVPRLHSLNEAFNLVQYIPFFTLGVLCYALFCQVENKERISILSVGGVVCIAVYILIKNDDQLAVITYLVMFMLFFLLVTKSRYLSFLENKPMQYIGVISYTIYLVHENDGILLIHRYGKYLGAWSPLSVLIVILLCIAFAACSYRFYEKNATRILKRVSSE